MKRIEKIICTLIVMACALTACAQRKEFQDKVLADLKADIARIEFSKLTLLSYELIQICRDSSTFNKFREKLINKSESLSHYSESDRIEHELVLVLLRKKVIELKELNSDAEKSRTSILKLLPDKSSVINVDNQLITEQLNNSKRGVAQGYDEGSTSESRFIFFIYDLIMLKSSLITSRQEIKWQRMGIFLCNYFRENELPEALRLRLKDEVTSILSRYPNEKDINQFKTEFLKCDVTKNRFD